jgi:phage regulator Rha-like protein
MGKAVIKNTDTIENKIYTVGGLQVMLDRDLATLYDVETRVLNQAVKRNINRFPQEFMFQLTIVEWENLKSQIVTSSWGGTRKMPYAFTEQGVAMLSGLLNSEKAIKINIAIMRAFVEIRNMLSSKNELSQQLKDLKQELEARLGEQDTQIIEIYDVLDQLMEQKHKVNTPHQRIKIGFKK